MGREMPPIKRSAARARARARGHTFVLVLARSSFLQRYAVCTIFRTMVCSLGDASASDVTWKMADANRIRANLPRGRRDMIVAHVQVVRDRRWSDKSENLARFYLGSLMHVSLHEMSLRSRFRV